MHNDAEKKVVKNLGTLLRWQKENPKSRALDFAVNYARIGLDMEGHALYVQCLYVLNNIQHWRGAVAGIVRAELKHFLGR